MGRKEKPSLRSEGRNLQVDLTGIVSLLSWRRDVAGTGTALGIEVAAVTTAGIAA